MKSSSMEIKRSNKISSLKEEDLLKLSHYGPVTCLKIYKDYVIAGYGPILKIFKISESTSTLQFSEQVFKRNKIHTIAVSKSGKKLVIGGGRSFMVLEFHDLLIQTTVASTEKAINEWIISIEFLDDDTILILNSHNTVYKVDISPSSEKFELVEKIHCNEKSILYSGSIKVLRDGRILIAAGTVMNGVIIWNLNNRTILHNLTDHEGSIFGVKIDSLGKFVISCSDDRSIKLFDLSDGKLLASGWGHGSRIWNLEFFKDSTSLRIFSTGEDCTVRIWEYHADNEILEQIELWYNAHSGKHIWSGDVDDTNLKLCVSGGADGRIRLHDLEDRGQREEYPLEMIQKQTEVKFFKNEIIKQYFELPTLDLLVISTSEGRIFTLNQVHKKFNLVSLTTEETKKFKNFGIMKGFAELNIVVICARNGELLTMEFKPDIEQPIMLWTHDELLGENKVTNLLSFSDDNHLEYYLLIDCPNPQIPLILKVFKFENGLRLLRTLQLEQPAQTSFTITCGYLDKVNNWLVLGSRYVTLAIYDLNSMSPILQLSGLFKKISPGDTITSISLIDVTTNHLRVLITVRDGVYMYIEFLKKSNFQMNVIHENKLSKGFIEGGYLKENDLILFGFKSSHFYIWNETKQVEITNELCGGAHRQWELFKYQDKALNYKFVYINKSTLFIKSFKGRFVDYGYGLINNGTHGREIRDVAIAPTLLEDNSKLMMTASEDATLKLSKVYSNGKIKNYWTLNSHVSGLQKIKFISDEFVGSSAANEEFYIWKIKELKENTPIITNFVKLIPKNSNPDLRIMDFDSFSFKNGFIISTVYSDSNIKIWFFDVQSKSFELLVDDFYSNCCILNVNFLHFQDKTILMIGTTDGHLSLWNVNDFINGIKKGSLGKSIIKQQLHQNGIKAILPVKYSMDVYKILTGGDDNSLILSSISNNFDKLILETNKFVESAASSTITSISKVNQKAVLVSSVDQIIRIWSFENDDLVCKSAKYTTIADTGCTDSTVFDNKTLAIIGGAGLSTFSYEI